MWLASWDGTRAAAVDFAITSGLQSSAIHKAANSPADVWGAYEDRKRMYLDIAEECRQQNLAFLPFVIEAHGGGLGPVARRVVAHIAKASAARHGEDPEWQAAVISRRISVSAHRENARAMIRRLPGPAVQPPARAPAAWSDDTDMWQ